MNKPSYVAPSTEGIFTAEILDSTNNHTFDASLVSARPYYDEWWEFEAIQEKINGDPNRCRKFSVYINTSTENGEHDYQNSEKYFISYIDINNTGTIYSFQHGTININFDHNSEQFKMNFDLTAKKPHEPESITVKGMFDLTGLDEPQRNNNADHDLLPEPRILQATGSIIKLKDVKDGATLCIPYSSKMAIGETVFYYIKCRGAIFGSKVITDTSDLIVKTANVQIYAPELPATTGYNVGFDGPESKIAIYTVVDHL